MRTRRTYKAQSTNIAPTVEPYVVIEDLLPKDRKGNVDATFHLPIPVDYFLGGVEFKNRQDVPMSVILADKARFASMVPFIERSNANQAAEIQLRKTSTVSKVGRFQQPVEYMKVDGVLVKVGKTGEDGKAIPRSVLGASVAPTPQAEPATIPVQKTEAKKTTTTKRTTRNRGGKK